jgi:hypothetical protein
MKKLSFESEKLKAYILETYPDAEGDEVFLAVMGAGLEARDLAAKAAAVIEREGLTVQGDRGNTKAHPLCAVVRDQRAQFLAAMKQLDLRDDPEPKRLGRPTDFDRFRAGKAIK